MMINNNVYKLKHHDQDSDFNINKTKNLNQ